MPFLLFGTSRSCSPRDLFKLDSLQYIRTIHPVAFLNNTGSIEVMFLRLLILGEDQRVAMVLEVAGCLMYCSWLQFIVCFKNILESCFFTF